MPKHFLHDVKRIADNVRKAIDSRIGRQSWRIAAGVIALVLIAIGVFLLLLAIGHRVERMQAEVQDLRAQVNRTVGRLLEVSRHQASIQTDLDRIQDRIGPMRSPDSASLDLTESQKRTILSFFDLRSQVLGPPKWKVGELVPQGLLKPVPEDLLKMVPVLKGTKYAFDLYGYVVIADAFQDRVLALIPLG